MSLGSLIVRAAGVGFIAWPLIHNLITWVPRFSRTRLEGIFPVLIGVQLLLIGMYLDRPGRRPRDFVMLLTFTAAIATCWAAGQLVAAIVVFLLQLPFLFRLDDEWRRTPRS